MQFHAVENAISGLFVSTQGEWRDILSAVRNRLEKFDRSATQARF